MEGLDKNAADVISSPGNPGRENLAATSSIPGWVRCWPHDITAQQACSGFKNLGQCAAAIHVSHNLDIPFADLKTRMTGDHSESLGKAIHEIKPDVNAKSEAKKGEKQANKDLSES